MAKSFLNEILKKVNFKKVILETRDYFIKNYSSF